MTARGVRDLAIAAFCFCIAAVAAWHYAEPWVVHYARPEDVPRHGDVEEIGSVAIAIVFGIGGLIFLVKGAVTLMRPRSK